MTVYEDAGQASHPSPTRGSIPKCCLLCVRAKRGSSAKAQSRLCRLHSRCDWSAACPCRRLTSPRKSPSFRRYLQRRRRQLRPKTRNSSRRLCILCDRSVWSAHWKETKRNERPALKCPRHATSYSDKPLPAQIEPKVASHRSLDQEHIRETPHIRCSYLCTDEQPLSDQFPLQVRQYVDVYDHDLNITRPANSFPHGTRGPMLSQGLHLL